MFSIITINKKDFITFGELALCGGEWILINDLIDIEMYDDWVIENPEPRMWGLAL